MKKLVITILTLSLSLPILANVGVETDAQKLDKLDEKQSEQFTQTTIFAGTTLAAGTSEVILRKSVTKSAVKWAELSQVTTPVEEIRTKQNMAIKQKNGLSIKSSQLYLKKIKGGMLYNKAKNQTIRNKKILAVNSIATMTSFAFLAGSVTEQLIIRDQMAELINCNPQLLDSADESDEVVEDLVDLVKPVEVLSKLETTGDR